MCSRVGDSFISPGKILYAFCRLRGRTPRGQVAGPAATAPPRLPDPWPRTNSTRNDLDPRRSPDAPAAGNASRRSFRCAAERIQALQAGGVNQATGPHATDFDTEYRAEFALGEHSARPRMSKPSSQSLGYWC